MDTSVQNSDRSTVIFSRFIPSVKKQELDISLDSLKILWIKPVNVHDHHSFFFWPLSFSFDSEDFAPVTDIPELCSTFSLPLK